MRREEMERGGMSPAMGYPIPGRRSPVVKVEEQLVGFHGRLTYIFSHEQEVGSIHFDRLRGDIFYKGHNIRHLQMEPWQWEEMEKLAHLLERHPKYHGFAKEYRMVLDKIVSEMERSGVK